MKAKVLEVGMRGTESDFLNKDMMNFFQRLEKIPQTMPLYASICANFSPHSLVLLASMCPIHLRISRPEQINPFVLLQCCSSSSPPEQCHRNCPASSRGWGEQGPLPAPTPAGLLRPAALCVQGPEALVGLNGPDRPHRASLPRALPMDLGPLFSPARGLWLHSAPACPRNPLILTRGVASHLDLGPAPRLWGCAWPLLPGWGPALTLACRTASQLAFGPGSSPRTSLMDAGLACSLAGAVGLDSPPALGSPCRSRPYVPSAAQ